MLAQTLSGRHALAESPFDDLKSLLSAMLGVREAWSSHSCLDAVVRCLVLLTIGNIL